MVYYWLKDGTCLNLDEGSLKDPKFVEFLMDEDRVKAALASLFDKDIQRGQRRKRRKQLRKKGGLI
jgi:hypothetical protein